MSDRTNPFLALARSRKTIVVLAALTACTVLAALGRLEVAQLVTVVAALSSVLVGAIALEDHGAKSSPTSIATTGNVNVRSDTPPLPPPPKVPS